MITKVTPTTTLKSLRQSLVEQYRSHNMYNQISDIDSILSDALNLNKNEILLHYNDEIPHSTIRKIQTIMSGRLKRIPLQYLLGKTEFFGLELAVTSNTFIPRPETEILVEKAIDALCEKREISVLEIGSGSGNIAIALAKQFSLSRIIAIDISYAALLVAKKNARSHSVEGRICFINADLFSSISKGSLFDIVISNPPYIPEREKPTLQEEVKNHEPETSLYGGKNGLDIIKRIISTTPHYIKPGGKLLMEIGHGQGQDILKYTQQSSALDSKILNDYNGLERIVEITYRTTDGD